MAWGPRAIASAVAKTTAPVFRKRGLADGLVVAEWRAVVGERLAAVSAPERLVFPPRRRQGGTLRLRIASSALALEIQHLQPQILERINGYFGYPAVARIQIVHGPLPKRAVPRRPSIRDLTPSEAARMQRAVDGIDDADLKAAVSRLGQAVLGRNAEV